jgi:hypothetical protein
MASRFGGQGRGMLTIFGGHKDQRLFLDPEMLDVVMEKAIGSLRSPSCFDSVGDLGVGCN